MRWKILGGLGFLLGGLVLAYLAWAAETETTQIGLNVTSSGASAGDLEITNDAGLGVLGDVPQGGSIAGTFDIENIGAGPLAGITIEYLGDPDLIVGFSCLGGCGDLAAGQTKTVNVDIDVAVDANVGSRLAPVQVNVP